MDGNCIWCGEGESHGKLLFEYPQGKFHVRCHEDGWEVQNPKSAKEAKDTYWRWMIGDEHKLPIPTKAGHIGHKRENK